MTPSQIDLILKLSVMGQVPKVDGNGLVFSKSAVRRFINDSGAVKRRPRSRLLVDPNKYAPEYFGIGFKEACATLLQDDYDLYVELFDLCDTMDLAATKFVESAEQAIILICHSSFGPFLESHIHQQSDPALKTVTLFKRLTHGDILPKMMLFDPVGPGSKIYERGYTNRKFVSVHERASFDSRIEFDVDEQALIFDAQFIPHKMTFTDDLWLAFVYDGAAVKRQYDGSYGLFSYNGE